MRRLIAPTVVAVLALAFLAGTARVAMTSSSGQAEASPSPAPIAASSAAPVAPSSAPRPSPAVAASPDAASPGATSQPMANVPRPTRRIADPALQRTLDAWLKRTGSPGASAAILWPDGHYWVGASGQADVSKAVPMTTSTEFSLASITKTFTAALVLQLVDEGKLGLDEKVAPLLPEAGLHPAMTVRHLLDHTSGLPDMFRVTGIEPALNRDQHRVWTVADALEFGKKDRVAPDTFWRYSNTGYVYLGQLLERVTGTPWATLVRERLLDPLGLDHTFVQGEESSPGPLARGHKVTGPLTATVKTTLGGNDPLTPFTSVVTAAGAAGAVASTAEDTARWAAALYSGKVFSLASLKAAVADVKHVDTFHPKTRYGLGVQLVPYDKIVTWGHSGSFTGFRDQMRWLPDQKISVVVLTNQSRLETHGLERDLIRLALKARPQPSGLVSR